MWCCIWREMLFSWATNQKRLGEWLEEDSRRSPSTAYSLALMLESGGWCGGDKIWSSLSLSLFLSGAEPSQPDETVNIDNRPTFAYICWISSSSISSLQFLDIFPSIPSLSSFTIFSSLSVGPLNAVNGPTARAHSRIFFHQSAAAKSRDRIAVTSCYVSARPVWRFSVKCEPLTFTTSSDARVFCKVSARCRDLIKPRASERER